MSLSPQYTQHPSTQEHLDQPASDRSHEGLGTPRDLGVGEQDLQRWEPAEKKCVCRGARPRKVSHSQHTGVPQLSLGTRGPGGEKGGPLRSHLHEI